MIGAFVGPAGADRHGMMDGLIGYGYGLDWNVRQVTRVGQSATSLHAKKGESQGE